MEKFDLMKDKPELDRNTLNYVWDILWRFNATTKPTNIENRTKINEREHIMNYLQELANTEEFITQ